MNQIWHVSITVRDVLTGQNVAATTRSLHLEQPVEITADVRQALYVIAVEAETKMLRILESTPTPYVIGSRDV